MTCNLLIMNEVNLQEYDKTFNDFIKNKEKFNNFRKNKQELLRTCDDLQFIDHE